MRDINPFFPTLIRFNQSIIEYYQNIDYYGILNRRQLVRFRM